MGTASVAVPNLWFSDCFVSRCTNIVRIPYGLPYPNTISTYGLLVIHHMCAATTLASLAIGVLKGATLGKGPD